MGREDMRAADADRERTTQRLRSALEEGRLDLYEYDERLQRAYQAKTYGELDRVVSDLPEVIPTQHSPLGSPTTAVVGPDPYAHATSRWLRHVWESYLGAVATTVSIWLVACLLSGELSYFWPIWVAGPWGLILAGQTVSGLVRGEPRRWVDRQERRRLARAAKRERQAALPADRQARHDPGPDDRCGNDR